MVTGKIRFNNVDDVVKFVNKVDKYDINVDIGYRNILIDGKSINGLLTIQLQVELTCMLHESLNNCKDIISDISCFIIQDFK